MNKQYTEYINQGILLMETENYVKAKEYFQKATNCDNQNEEAYMHYGNACANLEEFDNATIAFKRVIFLNKDNNVAYFNIANIYLLQNDIQKAVEYYNEAEKRGCKNGTLYETLSNIYLRLGDTTESLRNLTKAIKVEPMNYNYRIQKAKIYISIDKFAEAINTLDELEKIAPDAFEIYDLKTQIYSATKQYDKALETINYAVDRFNKDVVLQWLKIKVLVEMQKFEEAKQEIDSIKQKKGYDTVARQVAIQESTIYTTEKNIPKAIAVLEEGLNYEDDLIISPYNYILMNLYVSNSNYEKALHIAEILEKTEDESLFCVSGMFYKAYLTKLMGYIEKANERFKELCDIFRKITIKNMRFYEAYMYRALCHKEIGEYEKALELADYIENLFPERADAYAIKYSIYSDMGKTTKAEEQRLKAKEKNPDLNL